MFQRNVLKSTAMVSLLVFALLVAAPNASADGNSTKLLATVYGHFVYGAGWAGEMYIQLGDNPPVKANWTAVNTGGSMLPNGIMQGTETWSVELQDGTGALKVDTSYQGVPGNTPRFYNLIEVGTIHSGTGVFYGISGHMTVRGPFMLPAKKIFPDPLFMGECQGMILGLP